jgi:hypothetical protein
MPTACDLDRRHDIITGKLRHTSPLAQAWKNCSRSLVLRSLLPWSGVGQFGADASCTPSQLSVQRPGVPAGADELVITMNWLGVRNGSQIKFYDINQEFQHNPEYDFVWE